MGSKNKLKRFKENKIFKNVIEPTREEVLLGFHLKGNWNSFFCNLNPIVVEIGCGKGEYTVSLARKNPSKNFIGIDIKGARFWRGAKTAIEENIENVAFLRTQVELIDKIFNENEVSEIWITFPDPQIKYKRTKHRLTNPSFLRKYHRILREESIINLKTDSEFMYGYTLGLMQGEGHKILHANNNVYKNKVSPDEVTEIQTFYENKFLKENKPIAYTQFKLNY